MSEKEFKTYNEMLDLLASRGVDLSTPELRGRAKAWLQHEGYYNLINGYKQLFLEKDINGCVLSPEKYRQGSTVDEIYQLYSFDRRLRGLILRYILGIETNIKSLIAYTFSERHGHKNYLIYDNFDTSKGNATQEITTLFSDIQKQISNRVSDPSIQHYLTVHGYIPMWVLNNILTMGTVSKFYSLMKQSERAAIAKVFHVQDHELGNMLLYLSSVRNICAHGNRLYCYRTKRPLVDMKIHKSLNIPYIPRGELAYGKRDLFACMIVLKLLLSKNKMNSLLKQINKELFRLKNNLTVLSEEDVLSCMGFPADWMEILRNT